MSIENIEAAYSLANENNFSKALALISLLESENEVLDSSLLVLKGRCIQLAEETIYTLDDAKSAFLKAIQINAKSIEALTELGWFYYNVQDEPSKAKEYFQQALSYSKDNLLESIDGCSRCIKELESENESKAFIKNNSKLLS